MRLLITGGSGFIGKNLLPELADSGSEIWIFDQKHPGPNMPHVNYIEVDLTDKEDLERKASKLPGHFNACVHLAGQTDITRSLKDPVKDLRINALSVINLLDLFKFGRFIYVSTGSVYEGRSGKVRPDYTVSPAIPYAVSKYIGEKYTQAFYRTKNNPESYLILRLFNPYGPGEDPGRLIPRLVTQFGIRKDPAFHIKGSGRAMIDPMYVGDTAGAIVKALHSDPINQNIDICSGSPMTISALAQTIASVFNIEPRIDYSGESHEEITFHGDPEFQEGLLDFKPGVSFRDGIMRYYNFLKGKK